MLAAGDPANSGCTAFFNEGSFAPEVLSAGDGPWALKYPLAGADAKFFAGAANVRPALGELEYETVDGLVIRFGG